jgi:enoyl-[acyl-carrier-protein] reductase (NADH)
VRLLCDHESWPTGTGLAPANTAPTAAPIGKQVASPIRSAARSITAKEMLTKEMLTKEMLTKEVLTKEVGNSVASLIFPVRRRLVPGSGELL